VDAFWLSGLFMLAAGFASGLQFPTSLVGAQNAGLPADMGVSTSTTNLFRSLGGAVGVACMSALLLALLHAVRLPSPGTGTVAGEGGNLLLASLATTTGAAQQALRGELQTTFSHLLMCSAGVALLGLLAAIALPNRELRGR
jgi:hypothetical protein